MVLKRVIKSISKGRLAYLNQYIAHEYIIRPGKIRCGNIRVMVNRRNSIWIAGENRVMIMAIVGLNVMHKGIISNGLNRGVNDNCRL